jgi:hypothetical protein
MGQPFPTGSVFARADARLAQFDRLLQTRAAPIDPML